MAVDTREQSQLASMSYNQQQLYRNGPQFTDPWLPTSTVSNGQPYVQAQSVAPMESSSLPQRQNLTLPPYQALPISSSSLASGPPLQTAFGNTSTYHQYPQTTATNYAVPSYPAFDLGNRSNGGFTYPGEPARRPSHSFNNNTTESQRANFSNAVGDANRGLISLSQSDITPTPRNMYGHNLIKRSASPEAYGFPPPHSNHSSISSASGYHSSYNGSVHGSVDGYPMTDYSSASESIDLNRRILPPPASLGNSVPPAPQSMMGQFSSKITSSSQKKHKCKVCEKRFTRPSSLQTHMYSHTGEKPFTCDVEGCGRHFSVVSNLRRHKKVHRTESDTSSVTTNDDDDEELDD